MEKYYKYIVNEKGDSDSKAGIILTKENKIEVRLPIGFRYDKKEEDTEEFKKVIRKFIKLVSKKYEISGEENIDDEDNNFDFISAIKVLENYLQYGLYKQVQKEVKTNAKGKINWKKTINGQKMYVNNKIVYSNIYVNKINYFAEKEIQEIQKYCLNEISKVLSDLWNFNYKYENNRFNKTEMLQILNEELKTTNQDKKIEMLNNMKNFISNTNFKIINKGGDVHLRYKKFEHIWEELVDTLGIKDKSKYYPRAGYYYLENDKEKKDIKQKVLIPDTIIKEESSEYVYLLDAKYYKIGNLPGEYDIFKQVRYGEYLYECLEKEFKDKNEKNKLTIINAFVLPNINTKKVEVQDFYAKLKEVKGAKKQKKSYEKIYVVYVDTRSFIESPREVSKIIVEQLRKRQNQK